MSLSYERYESKVKELTDQGYEVKRVYNVSDNTIKLTLSKDGKEYSEIVEPFMLNSCVLEDYICARLNILEYKLEGFDNN